MLFIALPAPYAYVHAAPTPQPRLRSAVQRAPAAQLVASWYDGGVRLTSAQQDVEDAAARVRLVAKSFGARCTAERSRG